MVACLPATSQGTRDPRPVDALGPCRLRPPHRRTPTGGGNAPRSARPPRRTLRLNKRPCIAARELIAHRRRSHGLATLRMPGAGRSSCRRCQGAARARPPFVKSMACRPGRRASLPHHFHALTRGQRVPIMSGKTDLLPDDGDGSFRCTPPAVGTHRSVGARLCEPRGLPRSGPRGHSCGAGDQDKRSGTCRAEQRRSGMSRSGRDRKAGPPRECPTCHAMVRRFEKHVAQVHR